MRDQKDAQFIDINKPAQGQVQVQKKLQTKNLAEDGPNQPKLEPELEFDSIDEFSEPISLPTAKVNFFSPSQLFNRRQWINCFGFNVRRQPLDAGAVQENLQLLSPMTLLLLSWIQLILVYSVLERVPSVILTLFQPRERLKVSLATLITFPQLLKINLKLKW